RAHGLARPTLPAVDDHVRRDTDQPRAERRAAPLVLRQRGERLVEHVGRDVFRRVARAHAEDDVGVHPVEMPRVERSEPRRVPWGGFDELALVRVLCHSRHIYNESPAETLRLPARDSGFGIRDLRTRTRTRNPEPEPRIPNPESQIPSRTRSLY